MITMKSIRIKLFIYLENNKWRKFFLILLLILVVLFSVTIIFFNLCNTPQRSEKFAQLGEFFGGTINTFLTAINICVTAWLTIIVNKWLLENSNKQIESEKKIATIQLKHVALKEFRTELEEYFTIWLGEPHNLKYSTTCEKIIKDFTTNYDYLFDEQILSTCNDFSNEILELSKLILDKDKNNEVPDKLIVTRAKCGAIYSKIGIEIIK